MYLCLVCDRAAAAAAPTAAATAAWHSGLGMMAKRAESEWCRLSHTLLLEAVIGDELSNYHAASEWESPQAPPGCLTESSASANTVLLSAERWTSLTVCPLEVAQALQNVSIFYSKSVRLCVCVCVLEKYWISLTGCLQAERAVMSRYSKHLHILPLRRAGASAGN